MSIVFSIIVIAVGVSYFIYDEHKFDIAEAEILRQSLIEDGYTYAQATRIVNNLSEDKPLKRASDVYRQKKSAQENEVGEIEKRNQFVIIKKAYQQIQKEI